MWYKLFSVATGTQNSSDFYDSPGRSMYRRPFSPDVSERIVTGFGLVRTQIAIDGNNAAEEIVFLLKNEMYR